MAAVICNQQKQSLQSTVPQQSVSSQGLDSGLQSDGEHFFIMRSNTQLTGLVVYCLQMSGCVSVAYPGILFGGGSTNSVEDRGQIEWGSGGGSPLVRGSGFSCNLVQ